MRHGRLLGIEHGQIGVEAEGLVVGGRRPGVVLLVDEVRAAVEPGEQLIPTLEREDLVGGLLGRRGDVGLLVGVRTEQGQNLVLALGRVEDDVGVVEGTPVGFKLVVRDRKIGTDVRILAR